VIPLDEFSAACGEQHHAQEQPAVFAALDVGIAASTFSITYRQVDDFQIESGNPKSRSPVPQPGSRMRAVSIPFPAFSTNIKEPQVCSFGKFIILNS
jgi:hypothetical protein